LSILLFFLEYKVFISKRYYYSCSNIIIFIIIQIFNIKNIIIYVLNILEIKNSIICVMNIIIFTIIKSISIKNIIFCVINIIIFIIINIISKIITKLENNYS
jgi:hypothetical protein